MTGLFETLIATYRLYKLMHVLTLFIRHDPGNITEMGKQISSEIFMPNFFVNVFKFC